MSCEVRKLYTYRCDAPGCGAQALNFPGSWTSDCGKDYCSEHRNVPNDLRAPRAERHRRARNEVRYYSPAGRVWREVKRRGLDPYLLPEKPVRAEIAAATGLDEPQVHRAFGRFRDIRDREDQAGAALNLREFEVLA